jgi:hypothetical protein
LVIIHQQGLSLVILVPGKFDKFGSGSTDRIPLSVPTRPAARALRACRPSWHTACDAPRGYVTRIAD